VAADDAAIAAPAGREGGRVSAFPRVADPGSLLRAGAILGLGCFAVIFGVLVASMPLAAAGLIGVGLLAALAWFAPAANLTLLIFLTAIVPFSLQNQFSLGGGAGVPGLLASDIVLMLGLARAAISIAGAPLDRRTLLVCLALIGFLGIGALQAVHGVLEGRGASEVGSEYRVFLVLGSTALIAVPLLLDPRQRQRLFVGMACLGLALGMWALVQWTVDIPLGAADDFGVREGVLQTTAGRGQIQGGLFSYPVAVILSAAVLIAGELRSFTARSVTFAILGLNLAGLLLTYERTFWVATVIGVLFVVAASSAKARIRALFWGPFAAVVFFALMSTLAPDTLGAARERLLSLGRYESDNSLRYRIAESRHVIEQIEERPLFGSGLAAQIYWGRPWEQVPPDDSEFAHNAYLWLTWKMGLIGAAILLGAMLFVLIGRAPPAPTPLDRSLRVGAKAALLALMLSSVTFPAFTQLSSAAGLGLLIALCVAPMRRGEEEPA
jgi:hypothetical protein